MANIPHEFWKRQDGNKPWSIVGYLEPEIIGKECQTWEEEIQRQIDEKIKKADDDKKHHDRKWSSKVEMLNQMINSSQVEDTRKRIVLNMIQPPIEWTESGIRYRQKLSDKQRTDAQLDELINSFNKNLEQFDVGDEFCTSSIVARHAVHVDMLNEVARHFTCKSSPTFGLMICDARDEIQETFDHLNHLSRQCADMCYFKPSFYEQRAKHFKDKEQERLKAFIKYGNKIELKEEVAAYVQSLIIKSKVQISSSFTNPQYQLVSKQTVSGKKNSELQKATKYYDRLLRRIIKMDPTHNRRAFASFGEKVHLWKGLIDDNQLRLKKYLAANIAKQETSATMLTTLNTERGSTLASLFSLASTKSLFYIHKPKSISNFKKGTKMNPNDEPDEMLQLVASLMANTQIIHEASKKQVHGIFYNIFDDPNFVNNKTRVDEDLKSNNLDKEQNMSMDELHVLKQRLQYLISSLGRSYQSTLTNFEDRMQKVKFARKRKVMLLKLTTYAFAQQLAMVLGIWHDNEVAEGGAELDILRRSASDFELRLYRKYQGQTSQLFQQSVQEIK